MKVRAPSRPSVRKDESYATNVRLAKSAAKRINQLRRKLPEQWRQVISGAYVAPGSKPLSMDVMVATHGDITDKSAAQLQRLLSQKLGPEFASVCVRVTQAPDDDAVG